MARTLRNHRELLLNWFRARGEISNGSVEGMNNKAKLAMRKAYGFKSYETIEVALYHQLGKLPEPIQTHRFCRQFFKVFCYFDPAPSGVGNDRLLGSELQFRSLCWAELHDRIKLLQSHLRDFTHHRGEILRTISAGPLWFELLKIAKLRACERSRFNCSRSASVSGESTHLRRISP